MMGAGVGVLGGRFEGVGRALAGGEGWGHGSLIYRQIKSLHCSGYLLVNLIKQPQNLFEFIVKHCIFT